ncbi:hypothetical protein LEN26_009760, partial [Aphanomyces euteiches]
CSKTATELWNEHALFREYSLPVFRNHYRETSLRYGSDLLDDSCADPPPREIEDDCGEHDEKFCESSGGYVCLNGPHTIYNYRDLDGHCWIKILVAVYRDTSNFIVTIDESLRHLAIQFPWPFDLYDVEKAFRNKKLENPRHFPILPEVRGFQEQMETLRIRQNGILVPPMSNIRILLPSEVIRESMRLSYTDSQSLLMVDVKVRDDRNTVQTLWVPRTANPPVAENVGVSS